MDEEQKRKLRWLIALALILGLPVLGVLIVFGYYLWEYYHPQ